MKIKFQHRRIVIGLCLAVILLAGGLCGFFYYHNSFISIQGQSLSRDTQTLDLRGAEQPELNKIAQLSALKNLDIRDTGITAEDFDALKAALPQCQILWSVPFSWGAQDSDSETVTFTDISEEDLELLSYLPELSSVNANGCQDYGRLLALQQQYPDLEISYDVVIADTAHSRDITSLTLDAVDPETLAELLPHFPELTTLTLTGEQSDDDALFALMAQYPRLMISWDLDICGVSVNSLAAEVDISGVQVEDLAALEASLLRLPKLEKVVMCDCGISNEEMDALNRRHENIKFVWAVTIRGVTLRTDITALMPYKYNLWPNTQEAQDFKYFTDLECLDLGHHNISNCDFLAYMPKMKYLLLGDTQITDITPLEGLTELIYLELFLTGVKDYTPLLKLTKLESLNLCYTRGQTEIIAQLTWVDYIRWITADLSQVDRDLLKASLPNTLLELGSQQSSTGGQWRQTQNYFDMRDRLGMYYMVG